MVKQFEFLALELEVSKSIHIHVAGCYRTLSAENGALLNIMQLLSQFNSKELLALGDFNLNWLQPVSDDLKYDCDSLNLFQLVGNATRPNPKNPNNASLLDLILPTTLLLINTQMLLFLLMM